MSSKNKQVSLLPPWQNAFTSRPSGFNCEYQTPNSGLWKYDMQSLKKMEKHLLLIWLQNDSSNGKRPWLYRLYRARVDYGKNIRFNRQQNVHRPHSKNRCPIASISISVCQQVFDFASSTIILAKLSRCSLPRGLRVRLTILHGCNRLSKLPTD